jgi:hypothetical protein
VNENMRFLNIIRARHTSAVRQSFIDASEELHRLDVYKTANRETLEVLEKMKRDKVCAQKQVDEIAEHIDGLWRWVSIPENRKERWTGRIDYLPPQRFRITWHVYAVGFGFLLGFLPRPW